MRDSLPYISRSALIEYLVESRGVTQATAATYTKPSKDDRLVGYLLTTGTIEPFEHGWRVIDPVLSSTMSMAKNAV